MREFLHHLFVPRHSNNHRSKLLHHESLLIAIALLVFTWTIISGAEREYPAVLGDSTSISIADLLTDTNLKRHADGLPPLKLNKQLTLAAEAKAKDMFEKDYWAHISPSGTTPWVFIKSSGYEYLYAGENLARGYDTGSDVVDAWMASPTHRENLLSPNYTDIGFAVVPGTLTGSDTVLVVQEFGSPYYPADTASSSDAVISNNSPPVVEQEQNQSAPGVAGAQNMPLIDTDHMKDNIGYVFLLVFIGVLAIDAIVIERKQIARVFSHNMDHLLYLLFILLAGILIGQGSIL